jgi:hypothetical protein
MPNSQTRDRERELRNYANKHTDIPDTERDLVNNLDTQGSPGGNTKEGGCGQVDRAGHADQYKFAE